MREELALKRAIDKSFLILNAKSRAQVMIMSLHTVMSLISSIEIKDFDSTETIALLSLYKQDVEAEGGFVLTNDQKQQVITFVSELRDSLYLHIYNKYANKTFNIEPNDLSDLEDVLYYLIRQKSSIIDLKEVLPQC